MTIMNWVGYHLSMDMDIAGYFTAKDGYSSSLPFMDIGEGGIFCEFRNWRP